tara:strand:- start:53 stop:502 length:450 start_codon:yes stop_codon:yes gene_type:complete
MEIVGFEDYLIYDDGRVWSKNYKGKFLKPLVDNGGYLQVCLCNNGKRKYMRVHRLIALHYMPNPENKPQVDHWDNNRQNNAISNLRWATRSENQFNRKTYGAIKFKGVYKKCNKFQASITINGKSKYIGLYKTSEEANEAVNNFKISLV